MTETTSDAGELVGWFWSCDEESRKLPGTLRMESDGRMTLQVINHVSSRKKARGLVDMPFKGLPRPWYLRGDDQRLTGLVSGVTVSGRFVRDEEVTLDGCHCLTLGSMQQPRRVKFVVNTAYIGVSLQPDEELVASEISCRAEGIEGWLNPGGPNLSETKFLESSGKIETTVDMARLGRTSVRMVALGGFSREKGNAVEVRESGHLALRTADPVGWEALSDCLYSAYRFVRFALNGLCVIEQVSVDVGGRLVEVIEREMRDCRRKPFRAGQIPWEALFTASEEERSVVGSPESVLRRWLELPAGAEGTLLRLHALMIDEEFIDSQAVSVCGAAELWYTKILDPQRGGDSGLVEPMEPSAQDEVRAVFLKSGWEDVYQRRIAPVLLAPNELSTGEKVRRVFDPIEREVMGLKPEEPCEVSGKLLRLRHPLSHGGVGPDMSLAEMVTVVRKARAILKLVVLDYLGVKWRTVVRYNRILRWELGLDESWHALPYPAEENESEEPIGEEA